MHDSVLRLLGCARVVTRNARNNKIEDLRTLAKKMNVSSATLTNWKSRGVSKDGALKAEELFGASPTFVLDGVGKPFADFDPPEGFDRDPLGVLANLQLWDDMLVEDAKQFAAGQPTDAVAERQSLSRVDRIWSTNWEELMTYSKKSQLPERFVVQMVDDSMAPRVRAGARLMFDKTLEARPGDGVLVKDKTGELHFRLFRKRRSDAWEGVAVNDAYQTLDSQVDGLEIWAVLTGVESRWS